MTEEAGRGEKICRRTRRRQDGGASLSCGLLCVWCCQPTVPLAQTLQQSPLDIAEDEKEGEKEEETGPRWGVVWSFASGSMACCEVALLVVKLHMVVGFKHFPTDSEQTLMPASRQHPVSIAIEAEPPLSSVRQVCSQQRALRSLTVVSLPIVTAQFPGCCHRQRENSDDGSSPADLSVAFARGVQ